MELEPPSPEFCAGCAHAKAYRLPIHHGFLDGRSDLDWYQSVIDYLRWRAGRTWRPVHHSGPCVVKSYRDALFIVTQAYHGTLVRADIVISSPVPALASDCTPAIPKKPPTSERSAVRAEGVA